MFRSLVAALKARGQTVTVCEQTTGGLINARIMAVEGSSAVFHGGSISYNTKKGLPFLLNDSALQKKLLAPAIYPRRGDESEGQYYVRSKTYATAEIAKAFVAAAGTDYAIAEGGAAGPTFRPKGLSTGFSALAVARKGADGGPPEVVSQVVITSDHADREGNMDYFAASAAEELLRVVEGSSPQPASASSSSSSSSSFSSSSSSQLSPPSLGDVSAVEQDGFLDRCVALRDDAEAVAALRASDAARFVVVVDGGAEIMCTTQDSSSSGGGSGSSGQAPFVLALLDSSAALAAVAKDNDQGGAGGAGLEDTTFLGMFRGAPLFVVDVSKGDGAVAAAAASSVVSSAQALNTRTHAPLLPVAENRVALAAVALATWHRRARFCALSGAPTTATSSGHARRCTATGALSFPRQDPAVIAVVSSRDGERVLLARSPRHPEKMFTALAGFVEAGECFEEAVAREVHEETGVTVDPGSVKYLKSQPWPFPQSSMIAFTATADPEAPHNALDIDTDELVAAHWFPRDAVALAATVEGDAVMNADVAARVLEERPELELLIPPKNVVARDLIEAWLKSK